MNKKIVDYCEECGQDIYEYKTPLLKRWNILRGKDA